MFSFILIPWVSITSQTKIQNNKTEFKMEYFISSLYILNLKYGFFFFFLPALGLIIHFEYGGIVSNFSFPPLGNPKK